MEEAREKPLALSIPLPLPLLLRPGSGLVAPGTCARPTLRDVAVTQLCRCRESAWGTLEKPPLPTAIEKVPHVGLIHPSAA